MSTEKKQLTPEAYNIKLPKNTLLKLRCLEAKNDRTKENQHPMHTLTLEAIENAPINGVDINGLEFIERAVYTEKSLIFANRVRVAFGFPGLRNCESIPDARDFIGQVCFAICETEETQRVNEVTKEPVLDPYTNKPLVTYRRKISEWIPNPSANES